MIGYKKSIEWIAVNDEPSLSWKDSSIVEEQVSILLVSDQFNKKPYKVASDVLRYRAKMNRIKNQGDN